MDLRHLPPAVAGVGHPLVSSARLGHTKVLRATKRAGLTIAVLSLWTNTFMATETRRKETLIIFPHLIQILWEYCHLSVRHLGVQTTGLTPQMLSRPRKLRIPST